MKLLFSIYLFLTFTIIISCSDNSTDSDNNNQPGSRDYQWTIDTIQSGSIQTYLTSMWGSSSKSVWVSGYDADNSKCIYFFDGTRWNPAIYPPTYFTKQFYAMGGSGPNNIFFVGAARYFNPSPPPNFLDSALVLQFLNGSWIYHIINNSSELNALCLVTENEIFLGGSKGNLFKYNGVNWEEYFLGNADL